MLVGNFLLRFLALFILFAAFQEPALALKKSYIVYMGAHSHGPDAALADLERVGVSHTQLLSSVLGSEEKAKDALIYSYQRYINGFAASLEEEEAAAISQLPGVVSVFLNKGKKLHTTHSWDFLMPGEVLHSSKWKKAKFGKNTIIANLDTGVWPESKSFSGKGYGPIPSRWKGICQFNESEGHLCNRKLIGARYFNKGYAAFVGKLNDSFNSPRDVDGHGSHTLSTAGGNMVAGASVFGLGKGTARGGSPKARVAAYKVCWPPVNGAECFDSDIMSAFDAAIHDGVDVISLSLGGAPDNYSSDGIAIGSFHAVMNGVVVVASAGNDGPYPFTVSNVAPWILTVGASTIDREFEANVLLKNGSFFKGTSLSKPLPHGGFYSLISGEDAPSAHASDPYQALLCKNNTLDSRKVAGKIVVCVRGDNSRVEKGVEAARAGAVGMILCNAQADGDGLIADAHFLPATQITYNDSLVLFDYITYARNPRALITPPKAVMGVKPSPVMAAFSSRGPSFITPDILKPDVTAPGVNIIAAYSEATSPSKTPVDNRTTPFYVESGTSMSCPHVAGVAGLLKTLHPDWSPAAIKSAIMTSARTRDNTGCPMRDAITDAFPVYAHGSGDIRPNRAMDPGLVYDMSTNDYLDFLCGIGYNQSIISRFTNSSYACPKNYSILNMNYPSISAISVNYGSVTITRKLKNVGKPGRYSCRVKQAPEFRISVKPRTLSFSKIGEEKTFKVTIKSVGNIRRVFFGGLTWTDGTHYVRSPIVLANA